LIKQSKEMYQT